MVVDGHCHAGRGDGLTAPWNTAAPLDSYLRRAARAGIARTVILAPFHGNYRLANREVAGIAARHPGRLICFACVHARRDAGRIAEMVSEAVRGLGCRGLKVHAVDAPATREVCEAAKRWRLPILYDVAARTNLVEMAASEYPEVDFIVAHLGSFNDDFRAHGQVIDLMSRLPNVYADTSGVRRFDYLVRAVRRAGPGKLIFGSDGPWLHPANELQRIRLLGLVPDSERMVTGGNMLRLIGEARRSSRLPA
jgi:uncharacterized protein